MKPGEEGVHGISADLSQYLDQLNALLDAVRRHEAILQDYRSPYFDQTIVLLHSHLDGAVRALRGILDRLDN